MRKQKSFVLRPADARRGFFLVDADGQTVGRLASKIVGILRGKTNPRYTPHTDSGGFVVVINAEKVKFTGRKPDKKHYYRHSGYVGGIKSKTAREQLESRPEQVLSNAVKGMLPKNSLGRKQLKKLKISAGPHHPHAGQKPQPVDLKDTKNDR